MRWKGSERKAGEERVERRTHYVAIEVSESVREEAFCFWTDSSPETPNYFILSPHIISAFHVSLKITGNSGTKRVTDNH